MSSEVLTAMTGLGGTLVGAIVALTGIWMQERQRRRTSDSDAREQAYVDVLVASMGVAQRINTMIITLKTRSGPAEGVMVTLRQRKPMDAMEQHDWINIDLQPLMAAWTRAWRAPALVGWSCPTPSWTRAWIFSRSWQPCQRHLVRSFAKPSSAFG